MREYNRAYSTPFKLSLESEAKVRNAARVAGNWLALKLLSTIENEARASGWQSALEHFQKEERMDWQSAEAAIHLHSRH